MDSLVILRYALIHGWLFSSFLGKRLGLIFHRPHHHHHHRYYSNDTKQACLAFLGVLTSHLLFICTHAHLHSLQDTYKQHTKSTNHSLTFPRQRSTMSKCESKPVNQSATVTTLYIYTYLYTHTHTHTNILLYDATRHDWTGHN